MLYSFCNKFHDFKTCWFGQSCSLLPGTFTVGSLSLILFSVCFTFPSVLRYSLSINNVDKWSFYLQMFSKQLQVFRHSLEQCTKPIRMVDHWEQLRPVGKQRPVRCVTGYYTSRIFRTYKKSIVSSKKPN